MHHTTTRRSFLQSTAAIAAGLYVSDLRADDSNSPNEKLNIGIVGPGGRGWDNLQGVSGENIVAICDADFRRAEGAFSQFPAAARYSDVREMLEAETTLDAVVVSTPDHMHAHASIYAMRKGLHCYCEKPLTHSVWEARLMAGTAREYHLATQMGTQIHAENNYRRVVEIIQSGAIGDVHTVTVWCGKSWGGGERPTETPEIPEGLNWEAWLGPAPYRPYHPMYLPAEWRRWWDFGNGTLGDMGCHYMDLPFWALGLRHPSAVSAEGPPVHPETAPQGMKVTWVFPREGKESLIFTWLDGDMAPIEVDGHQLPGDGVYFLGTEGSMFADYGSYRLFPEEKFAGFAPPPETIPNSIGHHAEWIRACKTGEPTTCNFDYSGALTETVLLGNVAYRVGRPIEWDAVNLEVKNVPEAAALIRREYREGWEL